jgi:hypothetical protein
MSRRKAVHGQFIQGLTGLSNTGVLVMAHGFVTDGPATIEGRTMYMAFDGPQLAALLGAIPATRFTSDPEVLKAFNVLHNFLKGEDL